MNRQMDLFSFCSNEPITCKRCGSIRVVKDGRYRRISRFTYIYRCKKCGCRFVLATSDLERMRHDSSIISFATQLYSEAGISYRSVARILRQHLNIEVSYETVRNWLTKVSKAVYLPKVAEVNIETWAADETILLLNGRRFFLWTVFDPLHKLVLSWHISNIKLKKYAVMVLRKALNATGCRPKTIVTDHLPEYIDAIKKVLGHRFVEHTPKRLGGNNHIERFFREIKRRVRWFVSFRSLNGLKSFISTFIYCYHFIKPHRTLGWQTPASLT